MKRIKAKYSTFLMKKWSNRINAKIILVFSLLFYLFYHMENAASPSEAQIKHGNVCTKLKHIPKNIFFILRFTRGKEQKFEYQWGFFISATGYGLTPDIIPPDMGGLTPEELPPDEEKESPWAIKNSELFIRRGKGKWESIAFQFVWGGGHGLPLAIIKATDLQNLPFLESSTSTTIQKGKDICILSLKADIRKILNSNAPLLSHVNKGKITHVDFTLSADNPAPATFGYIYPSDSSQHLILSQDGKLIGIGSRGYAVALHILELFIMQSGVPHRLLVDPPVLRNNLSLFP